LRRRAARATLRARKEVMPMIDLDYWPTPNGRASAAEVLRS